MSSDPNSLVCPPDLENAELLPVRMLHDRVLVDVAGETGERRSSAGIVIPATAHVGKRLGWARVVSAGRGVRQVAVGDSVLFDPEERAEVEIGGKNYVLLRERDLHAVSTPDVSGDGTGLYLEFPAGISSGRQRQEPDLSRCLASVAPKKRGHQPRLTRPSYN